MEADDGLVKDVGLSANFPVLIDPRFEGEFLTTEEIWVPVIRKGVDKWNGISGSDWSFNIEGFGELDSEDGKTTIAACGFTFSCPGEPPPEPPGGEVPPGIPGTVAPQSIIAVTLIFGDDSLNDRIKDADIVFTRISILALVRSQDTPPLRRIPRLFALNPAHHLRR